MTGNKATARVLRVLSVLAESDGPSELKDLCLQLAMSRNMVFRALTTLIRQGYVYKHPTLGTYDIGYRVLDLRGHQLPEPDVRSICHPFLQQLHHLTSETALLSIIAGMNRFNIDAVQASGPRITHVQRGRPLPLHITITGRTLLAAMTDKEIESYIRAADFDEFPNAIASTPKILWAEIAAIRKLGYGFSKGETLPGLRQSNFIAFVVRDKKRRPHASLTVGGPQDRFTRKRAETLLPEMLKVVEQANLALRHNPAPSAFWKVDDT